MGTSVTEPECDCWTDVIDNVAPTQRPCAYLPAVRQQQQHCRCSGMHWRVQSAGSRPRKHPLTSKQANIYGKNSKQCFALHLALTAQEQLLIQSVATPPAPARRR